MGHVSKLAVLTLMVAMGAATANAQVGTPNSAGASAQGQATTGADNTRINARDKGNAAATPQGQSNAAGDRKLLAAVRRAIIADKSLSTSAHNVKILVANGAVALRGPVKSDAERAKVETLAKAVTGVSSVDNQIDVKAN